MSAMQEILGKLRKNLSSVIHGKDEVIEMVMVALCAGGHVLMEDVPGVGKTTLAKALASSIDGVFTRIQFTPDLLPADIVGSSVYNPKDGSFSFRPGPIFANILLADEINRASPRTQSALLEAMNEHQVSIEGRTYPLPDPFLVIATENPVEYHGTYPLPEAQLDRFAMQLPMGYPDEVTELEILYVRQTEDPLAHLRPIVSCADVARLHAEVRKTGIEKSVGRYMVQLIRETRHDARIQLGASPRALLTLARCAQARAFMLGRDYVLPDDVKHLAPSVLAHRLVLDNKAKHGGQTSHALLAELLASVAVPV